MALITTNLYIANSKYTYTTDGQQSCLGDADIFDIQIKKADIMDIMLGYINNDKSFIEKGLVAVFDEHKSNNEDYQFFRIYNYRDGWTYNDYRNSNKSIGFGFIGNRVINI